jgi:uncharacterized Zn-finger protein
MTKRKAETKAETPKFVCSHPDCISSDDAVFDSSWSFTRHMRVHNNVLPFQCNFCDKKFVQKCSRDRHQATHTQARPWGCAFCDKRFKLKEYRTQHLANIHPDILRDVENYKNINPDDPHPDIAVLGRIRTLEHKIDRTENLAKTLAARLQLFHIALKPQEAALLINF